MGRTHPNTGAAAPARRTAPALRGLLAKLEAALGERQVLLARPDTPAAQARIDALELRLEELMDQLTAAHPPASMLEDEAVVPGEFDRFVGRGDPERRAG